MMIKYHILRCIITLFGIVQILHQNSEILAALVLMAGSIMMIFPSIRIFVCDSQYIYDNVRKVSICCRYIRIVNEWPSSSMVHDSLVLRCPWGEH